MKFLGAGARAASSNLVAIGAAGVVLYISFPFTTGREAFAMLGGIALVIGYHIDAWRVQTTNRLRQLEGNVASLTEHLSAASYKIILIISPNWNAIIEKGLSEATNRAKVVEFFSGRKPELAGKSFRFICFSGGVPSVTQWWSDFEKTFVNGPSIIDPMVQGNLYELPFGNLGLDEDVRESVLTKPFEISPDHVGFDTSYAPGPGFSKHLSKIPYTEIIWFLMGLHKHVGDVVMHGIKTFPKKLQDEFDEHNVRYQAEEK